MLEHKKIRDQAANTSHPLRGLQHKPMVMLQRGAHVVPHKVLQASALRSAVRAASTAPRISVEEALHTWPIPFRKTSCRMGRNRASSPWRAAGCRERLKASYLARRAHMFSTLFFGAMSGNLAIFFCRLRIFCQTACGWPAFAPPLLALPAEKDREANPRCEPTHSASVDSRQVEKKVCVVVPAKKVGGGPTPMRGLIDCWHVGGLGDGWSMTDMTAQFSKP